jgi:hypothetical protein
MQDWIWKGKKVKERKEEEDAIFLSLKNEEKIKSNQIWVFSFLQYLFFIVTTFADEQCDVSKQF